VTNAFSQLWGMIKNVTKPKVEIASSDTSPVADVRTVTPGPICIESHINIDEDNDEDDSFLKARFHRLTRLASNNSLSSAHSTTTSLSQKTLHRHPDLASALLAAEPQGFYRAIRKRTSFHVTPITTSAVANGFDSLAASESFPMQSSLSSSPTPTRVGSDSSQGATTAATSSPMFSSFPQFRDHQLLDGAMLASSGSSASRRSRYASSPTDYFSQSCNSRSLQHSGSLLFADRDEQPTSSIVDECNNTVCAFGPGGNLPIVANDDDKSTRIQELENDVSVLLEQLVAFKERQLAMEAELAVLGVELVAD